MPHDGRCPAQIGASVKANLSAAQKLFCNQFEGTILVALVEKLKTLFRRRPAHRTRNGRNETIEIHSGSSHAQPFDMTDQRRSFGTSGRRELVEERSEKPPGTPENPRTATGFTRRVNPRGSQGQG